MKPREEMKLRAWLLLALLLASWLPASTSAQLLQGQWVVDAQVRIHEHRKGNVRVIVMGRDGRPAPGATVAIRQTRHAFPLGFVAHDRDDIDAAGAGDDTPVLRVFNAVALDPLTHWPTAQPTPDAADDLDTLVDAALRRDLRVRFGGVLSADAGLIPDWAAALPDADFAAAVDARVRRATALAPRVADFDLYTHALRHAGRGGVTQRLGPAGLRRLFHLAHAHAPEAAIALRVEDALVEQRVPEILRRVRDLREAFLPLDALAVEQRLGGILPHAQLERAFRLFDSLDLPLVLASLEVAGTSASAAAVNLETTLRLAFASPRVAGIYLAGLHDHDVVDPAAALLHHDNTPTEPGRMLDNLFRQLWWTHDTFAADELGNVHTRVFAGNHRITATLPDGTELHTLVHVPNQALDDLPLIVLLEP